MSAPDLGQPIGPPISGGAASPAEKRVLLATCVGAAVRAAAVIRDGAARRSEIVWEEKSPVDFVSEIDRRSEEVIDEIVRSRHPDARLVAEELSPQLGAEHGLVFVADPLDGTTNFLHGFPWYAVSIAAVVDGVVEAGAILNAATGELFTAVAGGGARRAGQPITVSTIAEPLRALIGTGFPFKQVGPEVEDYLRILPGLMQSVAGLRRPGAAALDLADVACGRFDAFFELKLAPWDIAAGILLVREAGGVITDRSGAPATVAHTSIVAGNQAMHPWLLARVAAPLQ